MDLPSFRVYGKVAIVTGANQGLGKGIALTGHTLFVDGGWIAQ
jgi:hypothetical protein